MLRPHVEQAPSKWQSFAGIRPILQSHLQSHLGSVRSRVEVPRPIESEPGISGRSARPNPRLARNSRPRDAEATLADVNAPESAVKAPESRGDTTRCDSEASMTDAQQTEARRRAADSPLEVIAKT